MHTRTPHARTLLAAGLVAVPALLGGLRAASPVKNDQT